MLRVLCNLHLTTALDRLRSERQQHICASSCCLLFLQVRDTRQNAESSRSHQVVRIFVESRPSMPAMPEGALLVLLSTFLPVFCMLNGFAKASATQMLLCVKLLVEDTASHAVQYRRFGSALLLLLYRCTSGATHAQALCQPTYPPVSTHSLPQMTAHASVTKGILKAMLVSDVCVGQQQQHKQRLQQQQQ